MDGTLEIAIPELPVLGELDFTILGGWEEQDFFRPSDADGTELEILDTSDTRQRHNYTGEFRFASNNGGKFDWIGGVFYFKRKYEETIDTQTRTSHKAMTQY